MPKPEVVSKMLAQIRKRPANHHYFFSKLQSPDWLAPLDEAGLFASPPAAVREVDGGISFPFWPESQYLARIAPQAAEQVAAIMMRIPETDNVRVHEDLARAATHLTGPLAAQWARKEIAWIAKQPHLYFVLPDVLGQLTAHLARTGQSAAGLRLAKRLLAIDLTGDGAPRVAARFDPWQYEKILKEHFPELLKDSPFQSLALVCDLLECAIVADSEHALSWIWRPAIEPHSQNHGRGEFRDALVDAVRDGAWALVEQGEELRAVVEFLRARGKPIFIRIADHLAAENPTHEIARELACIRDEFFEPGLRHEYTRLLAAVFGLLSADEQALVFFWIEEGPPLQTDDAKAELREEKKRYWQAGRLAPLRGQLPADWERRLSELVDEVGEPEHPSFMSYVTSWVGPTSSKSADELKVMDAEEIASYLKSWTASEDWKTPQPEGLGRVLESVVKESPGRFVQAIGSFVDVDPSYAGALIRGFEAALRAGRTVDRRRVVEYLRWVADQPRDKLRTTSDRRDVDPHWGWTRKAAASLLSNAMEEDKFDQSLRGPVWDVIDIIADDPDPRPEDDQSSTMDPATQSINSTRGEALHAVVQYALWVRRSIGEDREFDMNSIPEVRDRLDRHLDSNLETSPAIRSIFGRWFPWLLSLDPAWAKDRVDAIFPSDDSVLRDAAWFTYVVSCPVYDNVFDVLRQHYSEAVDRLADQPEHDPRWGRRVGERLGRHLMAMVGRGKLHWGDDHGVLKRFFDGATSLDASGAISSVGHSLLNAKGNVPSEVVGCFRTFWSEFSSAMLKEGGDRTKLLLPFGWWFASGRFDDEWSLAELKRVVEVAHAIDPDFMVMERLAELSSEFPQQALSVFQALVQGDKDGLYVLDWKDCARRVLEAALRFESSRDEALALIHELGVHGHLQFRSLLPK